MGQCESWREESQRGGESPKLANTRELQRGKGTAAQTGWPMGTRRVYYKHLLRHTIAVLLLLWNLPYPPCVLLEVGASKLPNLRAYYCTGWSGLCVRGPESK